MKLLIADDEQYVRASLTQDIDWSQHGIHVAGVASDGKEAVEMGLLNKPDLLLTDIRMPFLSGIEVMRQLKQVLPQLKVVLLSGWGDFDYAREALRLGASDYLVKPCPLEEIVDSLLVAARASEDHAGPVDAAASGETKEPNALRHSIKMACEIIHSDLSVPVTLSEVAGRLHLNPSSLSRLFRQEMGISFSEYITNSRMNIAKKMLIDSNMKIHEIALMVGYVSVSHFVQVFGEYTGMTPGTFRETYG